MSLEPHFVSGLENYESYHDGPFGRIISNWSREKAIINYNVVVPANSTATVHFTGISGKKVYVNGKEMAEAVFFKIQSGRYHFEIK